MRRSMFPYPGGKYNLAEWIVGLIPDHDCYVEAFGGSGGVLFSKSPSTVEVYNDIDEDVVQFYRMVREREDDLVRWLRRVPYARSVHHEWATEFYDGHRPDDPIERAGRFFYLRHSQFASKYDDVSGWSSSRLRNEASKFGAGTEQLLSLAHRLRPVQIERRDFATLIPDYDGEDTFFYIDPPYLNPNKNPYHNEEAFDRNELATVLEATEGRWMVSLATVVSEALPEDPTVEELVAGAEADDEAPLTVRDALREDRWLRWHDTMYSMRRGVDEWEKQRAECLLTNFDPADTPLFVDSTQTNLASFDATSD